jgi:hypothetical protein
MSRSLTLAAAAACFLLSAPLALAQATPAQAPPASAPAQLGALAPENLNKKRPKAPFNLTGTWIHDMKKSSFRFGPPYPKFTPAAQKEFDAGVQATKEGRAYHDYIGQCYPAGMPVIMTRVWPIAMVQLPTVIYMVSGFENAFREIFIDGRPHMPADEVVPSFNGESIGHFEGDTLVVDTTAFTPEHHTIDVGVPISDQFHMVERMRMLDKGKTLEIAYTMTDPKMWEGEWKSTKWWKRVDDQDIVEVECTPDLDQHLPATQSKLNVR